MFQVVLGECERVGNIDIHPVLRDPKKAKPNVGSCAIRLFQVKLAQRPGRGGVSGLLTVLRRVLFSRKPRNFLSIGKCYIYLAFGEFWHVECMPIGTASRCTERKGVNDTFW